MKHYGDFISCNQMTVGELKKRLLKYTDDTRIFMEASNVHGSGDTMWAQKLLDIYSCDDNLKKGKEALMLVGSVR
ncbi:MAG: hypothetical protein KAX49_11795 [Halanaerobiales bacterium]|nr:hypothetical protein [Halanaerobiales bacterium]